MNPHKGKVKITLAQTDYELRYDMNALCELEEKLGKPVHEIFNEAGSNVGIHFLRETIFIGLRCAGGKNFANSLEVGRVMKFDEIEKYTVAMAEALAVATGGPENPTEDGAINPVEDAEKAIAKVSSGIGENSKSMPAPTGLA